MYKCNVQLEMYKNYICRLSSSLLCIKIILFKIIIKYTLSTESYSITKAFFGHFNM